MNREPQRQGALCPGAGRQRSPTDAPGEELEAAGRAGDRGLLRAAADSLRARSPASRGSSWLQPAQSRRLIPPHRGLRPSVPHGAERRVLRSPFRLGWSAAAGQSASRLRHPSLRPPRGSKCGRTPRCSGKGTDSAWASRSSSRPPLFPTARSASRQTPGTNAAARGFSSGVSNKGLPGDERDRARGTRWETFQLCSPRARAESKAAFVAFYFSTALCKSTRNAEES